MTYAYNHIASFVFYDTVFLFIKNYKHVPVKHVSMQTVRKKLSKFLHISYLFIKKFGYQNNSGYICPLLLIT